MAAFFFFSKIVKVVLARASSIENKFFSFIKAFQNPRAQLHLAREIKL